MDKSPWWRSGECECWLLWREQGLPHHSPSTERSPILAFTQSQRRIVEIQTLIRNMSSPEESVAPTILSGSRRRSKPRGLSSPLDQLINPSSDLPRSNKVKHGKARQNKAKQSQTRSNKVKQGHLFSSASWWWRCPMLRPCACCLQASICPENAKIFRVLFETFVTDLFLPHPFKFINEIGTVQVIPGLPGIILRVYYRLNYTNYWAEARVCWKFLHAITSSPKPRHLRRYSVLPFLPTLLSITWREEEATTVG